VSEGKYYSATTFIKTPRRLIFPTPHPQQILPPALAQKKTKDKKKIQILGYMILL